MKNSWSKEDRHHYNKSEVMQELEKRVLETISRVEILSKKALNTDKTKSDLQEIKREVIEINQLVDGAEDDLAEGLGLGESKEHHNVSVEVGGDASFRDSVEDDMEDQIKESAISELRELAKLAVDKGNYKLAYKIERTIDEISEEVVACEL